MKRILFSVVLLLSICRCPAPQNIPAGSPVEFLVTPIRNASIGSYDIQGALNAIAPGGPQWGTNVTGALLRLSAGDFYVSNALFYSNTFPYNLHIQGSGILNTRIIYAGTTRTNLLTICGGGNPGGGLNLPANIQIENCTFMSITNDLLSLVILTNYSYAKVSDCNFTGWELTTNNLHGASLSIDGPYPSQPPGNVGLVIGCGNEHGTFVEDCFFAGLACGIDAWCDHFYGMNLKSALIGNYGAGTDGTGWPTTSPYSQGPFLLFRGQLDIHLFRTHFYIVNTGIMCDPGSASATAPIFLSEPQWETADHSLIVSSTSQKVYINEIAIADDATRYLISSRSPYTIGTTTAFVPTYALYNNVISSGPSINGSGIAETNFAAFFAQTNLCNLPAAGFAPTFSKQNETATTNNNPVVFAPGQLPNTYGGDVLYHEVLIHKTASGDQPVIFPPPYVTNINLTSLGGTYRCTNNSLAVIRIWPGLLTNAWVFPIN